MDYSQQVIDFQRLHLERVIDESAYTKSITFQGKYDGHTAVIRLEKSPFDEQSIKDALNSKQTTSERNLNNDIYSRYKMQAPQSSGVNDLKAIVVLPANETVLAKYSKAETILFSETDVTYHSVVEPFICNMLATDGDHNRWVYNILEGKSETDHVILNDPDPDSGFILLPSLKASADERELHILAICHRRDIRSLRDLNDKHLQLLKNILDKGTKTIREKFASNKGQLRAYIHYQPTFYHFHVHFQMIDASEYKSSDRDNLLITVINNISLMPNYYHSSTMTYPLSKGSALYKKLESANCL